MSWFKQISDYIDNNLDEFIKEFFSDRKTVGVGRNIRVNPAPCCGHNDCFSIAKNMNAFHCFSCGASGTRIQAIEMLMGEAEGKQALADWSGIELMYDDVSREQMERYTKEKRLQKIYQAALDHYQRNLRKDKTAMRQQLMGKEQSKGDRMHSHKTLEEFQVGVSGNYKEFYDDMLDKGFTKEEMKEAARLIWFPEGYYVYPYFDVKGRLKRLNGKLLRYHCMGKRKADGTFTNDCDKTIEIYDNPHHDIEKSTHENHYNHTMTNKGFSRGDKTETFYFKKNGIRNKTKAILVEGENDVISLDEAFKEMPNSYQKEFAIIGTGGNMNDEMFDSQFLRQFDAIYEAFDNDDAGVQYRNKLGEQIPDIPVYHIDYDEDFTDIDQFLKSEAYQGPDELKEMIDMAHFVPTTSFVVERERQSNTWWLKNREFQMSFNVERFNNNGGQLEGTLLVYQNGQVVDKKPSVGLDKVRVAQNLVPSKIEFSEHLHHYYNDVPWNNSKPERSFWELNDILPFSKAYRTVLKQLAWYLYNASKADYEERMQRLQRAHNQQVVAEILKEMNGYQNADIDDTGLFPRLSLSQFFSVTNNDAFFYYTKIVRDGEDAKLVPCLISNDQEEIRLDLLKRKDPQSMLLVNNKYELPMEVETAVMDPVEVSVQPYWVSKWVKGEITSEDYKPSDLINEIYDFIVKCYYIPETTARVVSLWIYSTYFYMLFKNGFPYLIFTGSKGSGKSTMDTLIYLLSLNAKFALDMTQSALFRTVNFQGGTLILDEIENLTDKRAVDNNGYATVLKGGYSDSGSVYRTNQDKGGVVERFSVFGPKVISNINGIEDVIGDRCIYVRTVAAPDDKLADLENPQLYKDERRHEVHAITSRCALSALENFQRVYELYNDAGSRLTTGNARLSQILKPLLAIARFVDEGSEENEYEKHLLKFYETDIREVKEEIAGNTLEGMIRNILQRVAEEKVGIEKERWATTPGEHLYQKPIDYNQVTGQFEINALHIKTLVDETNNDEPVPLKEINATMNAIIGSGMNRNLRSVRTRTHTTLKDENLQRQMGDKKQIKVYKFTLNIKDFIPESKLHAYVNQNEEEERPLF